MVSLKNQEEAVNSIGMTVLAFDGYWGSYIGELVGTFNTPIGVRAKVKIFRNIELLSQYAIIFHDCFVNIQPYIKGVIKNFDLSNV